jgi:hypothetical protein
VLSEGLLQTVNCFSVYVKFDTRILDKIIKKENASGKSYVFIIGINIYPMYIFLYETFKKIYMKYHITVLNSQEYVSLMF